MRCILLGWKQLERQQLQQWQRQLGLRNFFKSLKFQYSIVCEALSSSYEDRQKLSKVGKLSNFYQEHSTKDEKIKTPAQIHCKFGSFSRETLTSEQHHTFVGGRVLTFRQLSSNLIFMDLFHDGERIQTIMSPTNFPSKQAFSSCISSIQRGDIVLAEGIVDRTKSGELSVRVGNLTILTPCLNNIPDVHAPEMTEEHQSRWRHLDFISRPESLNTFKTRSKIIKFLRDFMGSKDFLEVETPILSTKVGGALAKPFKTQLEAMNLPLSLRIAPELFLKQLIVGGFNRIFELGKVFRNEGIDATHNPEFTSLEMYQSFASMEVMISLVEEIMQNLSFHLFNCDHVQFQEQELSLKRPFKRIDITLALEDRIGCKFNWTDPSATLSQCLSILDSHKIRYEASIKSLPYLFDKLIGHFIEPSCIQPTFLINHPLFQSPLARAHPLASHLSARFELFVAGRELANGYSELNDPYQQKLRFTNQLIEHDNGNEEAHLPDEDFVKVLEAGMPPTAGCGIGVDRLVMLFTNKRHIRDVIFFPINRPLPHPGTPPPTITTTSIPIKSNTA